MGDTMFGDLASVREGLKSVEYLADDGIASVVYLAEKLGKPVLVEGPAGVGKTELAKSVAAMTDARLIRLQCYEGLDEAKALYEWNYKKQLLRIQADRGSDTSNEDWVALQDDIFNDEFLELVAGVLVHGGELHSWSDVGEYFQTIRDLVDHHADFHEEPLPDLKDPEHDMDYLTSYDRKGRRAGSEIHRGRWRCTAG